MPHAPSVQRLGRNSVGTFFARATCECGWLGRLYRARQSTVAVRSARSEAEIHAAHTAAPPTA
jgi:hypothetical protein